MPIEINETKEEIENLAGKPNLWPHFQVQRNQCVDSNLPGGLTKAQSNEADISWGGKSTWRATPRGLRNTPQVQKPLENTLPDVLPAGACVPFSIYAI